MTDNHKTELTAEPGKQEIIASRIFNAPREFVFKVYNDPEHIPEWWGPAVLKTVVEKMEVKSGGSWRIMQSDPKGRVHAFHGVYHEVTVPERIINTFEYEGLPEKGHVVLETKYFEELPGNKTKIIMSAVFQSAEDREGMIKSGMEGGLIESMERLAQLIAKLN